MSNPIRVWKIVGRERSSFALYPRTNDSYAMLIPERKIWVLYCDYADFDAACAMICEPCTSATFSRYLEDESGVTWNLTVRVAMSDEDNLMLRILLAAGEVPS